MKKVKCLFGILILASLTYAQNWMSIETMGSSSGDVKELYWDSVDSVTYIVGTFKYVNGVEVNGVCKYDGEQILPLNSGFDHFIGVTGSTGMGEIKRFQNKLYFGHSWPTVDSVMTNGIATWDGENWHAVGNGLLKFESSIANGHSGTAFCMSIFQDDLYVAGVFDIAGTDTTQNLARWDGETWHAVHHPYGTWGDQGFYGFHKMTTFDGYLYVCGNFDTPDGKRSVVRYDGENWETVGVGILGGQDFPFGMIVYHNELYIYGSMRKSAGNAGNKIMKLKNDEWVEVGGGIAGSGRFSDAIVIHDKLYLAGPFTHVGDNSYFPSLAVWDGEKWCGTGTVFSGFQGNLVSLGGIERFEDDFLVSGNFYTIDADSMTKVARWIGGDYLAECGEIVSSSTIFQNDLANLTISPNPTQGQITIAFPEEITNQPATLHLYNTLGNQVWSQPLSTSNTNQSYDFSMFPPGMYLVEVVLLNAKERMLSKLIIGD